MKQPTKNPLSFCNINLWKRFVSFLWEANLYSGRPESIYSCNTSLWKWFFSYLWEANLYSGRPENIYSAAQPFENGFLVIFEKLICTWKAWKHLLCNTTPWKGVVSYLWEANLYSGRPENIYSATQPLEKGLLVIFEKLICTWEGLKTSTLQHNPLKKGLLVFFEKLICTWKAWKHLSNYTIH